MTNVAHPSSRLAGQSARTPVLDASALACPLTGQSVGRCSLEEAERQAGEPLEARPPGERPPFGCTDEVLLRADRQAAYPVVDGIPVLMGPEVLRPASLVQPFDLRAPQYAEAYEEMAYYNAVAREEAAAAGTSAVFRHVIQPVLDAAPAERAAFPYPRAVWLDAIYDCAAQWDAYRHLAPLRGGRVLQLGGSGLHAIKFLLAGAAEGWVVTPMLGEALVAHAMAQAAGVAGRLRCVVGVAEELPFADATFDAIYSGGCVHHMVTAVALPEAARVLRAGGRFGAMDPWRAPLYAWGTRLMGKREPEVYCRPLTPERVAPLQTAFGHAEVIQHGALTRYPLLTLNKLGVSSSLEMVWQLGRIDDRLSTRLGLRHLGSSVALLGTKR